MRSNQEASGPAQRAAERHEQKQGHATTDLWDDDTKNVLGKCCIKFNCNWIRYNREPRAKSKSL